MSSLPTPSQPLLASRVSSATSRLSWASAGSAASNAMKTARNRIRILVVVCAVVVRACGDSKALTQDWHLRSLRAVAVQSSGSWPPCRPIEKFDGVNDGRFAG